MATGLYRTLADLSFEDSLLNRGLFFGESPFTTMLLKDGRIIGLDLHMHRLKACVEYLFKEDFNNFESDIRSLINSSIEKSGIFYLRVTFTKTLSGKIEFFLFKDHFSESTSSIDLNLSKVIKGKSLLPNFLKVGNYLEYSKELESRKDCNEIVYQDYEGNILESGVSNIFIIDNGVVLTPSLKNGILDGVMRQILIQFLGQENIPFKETNIAEEQLHTCSEIWLTNGLRGVRVVNSYDKRNLSNELWSKLNNSFAEYCEKL
jgi:branched-subunit amino acid aminotransferase/4-amino-4-deoxychorismate lyase